MGVAVEIGVGVAVGAGVGVDDAVAVGVAVGAGVDVALAVAVGVAVGTGVDVARSNASGAGKNYGISLASTTGVTSNFNDLLATGTGGVLGQFGGDRTTLAAWRTATGLDANSVSVNPQLIAPTGTSATVNLHLTSDASPVEVYDNNQAVDLNFGSV